MPVACATLLLAVVPPMLSTCCTELTRSKLVQANAVLKCDADASKPITMDKLCSGAREVLAFAFMGLLASLLRSLRLCS